MTKVYQAIGKIALSLIFLAGADNAQAQRLKSKTSTGVNVYTFMSGSGHGSNINFSGVIRSGRHNFMLGPNIGKGFALSGIQGGYQYLIPLENLKVFLFYNGIYHQTNALKSNSEINDYVQPEGTVNTARYTTGEHYAGYGFRFKLINNTYLDAGMGVGIYHTRTIAAAAGKSNFTGYSLMLKAAVGINSRKN